MLCVWSSDFYSIYSLDTFLGCETPQSCPRDWTLNSEPNKIQNRFSVPLGAFRVRAASHTASGLRCQPWRDICPAARNWKNRQRHPKDTKSLSSLVGASQALYFRNCCIEAAAESPGPSSALRQFSDCHDLSAGYSLVHSLAAPLAPPRAAGGKASCSGAQAPGLLHTPLVPTESWNSSWQFMSRTNRGRLEFNFLHSLWILRNLFAGWG